MPSFQSLVLTDRQSTPVNHTLTPVGEPRDGVFTVAVADATGASISEKTMSITARRVNGKQKTVEKFTFPVMVTETINGVPLLRVARVGRIVVTTEFEDTHTLAEKNDAIGMFASAYLPSKTLVHDTVVKGEGVW